MRPEAFYLVALVRDTCEEAPCESLKSKMCRSHTVKTTLRKARHAGS